MKAVLAVALLAMFAFSAFAYVDHMAALDDSDYVVEPEDVDELCELVGRHSGCSGCVLGTKKLCTWVAANVALDKKRALSSFDRNVPVTFMCVSTESFKEDQLEAEPEYEDQSTMCPSNPLKEPIINFEVADRNGNTLPFSVAHTMNTTWFTNELAEFPTQPWAVDRTSLFGSAGFAISSGISDNWGHHYDCAHFNSRYLQEPEECTDFFYGTIQNAQDKFCTKYVLSALLSTRCPAYGVAVSGLCESAIHQIWKSCTKGTEEGQNMGPNHGGISTYTGEDNLLTGTRPMFLQGFAVVPDDTPFCLEAWPIQPSGELEHIYGLDTHYDEDGDEDAFEFGNWCSE